MGWFEVDKKGLQSLMGRMDRGVVLRELIQNSWDEPGVTRVNVSITPVPNSPMVEVSITDDAPEGFVDLSHAFTLFARTRKRANPETRGRFNIGEKLVLSLCREAQIITTTGGVHFHEDGERRKLRAKRDEGSVFWARMSLTRSEMEACIAEAKRLLPPEGIKTIVNGHELQHREPKAVVEATLQTEFEDEEGNFRPTQRKTRIEVYEPFPGEEPMIYEMGIPVTETGDRWHYNVCQKVPLTVDRDNVKPSFLRDVRSEVLNKMVDELPEEDASEGWVRDAMSDERIAHSTVHKVAKKRWGDKFAVATPGDNYGRDEARAKGYHLVSPSEMSKDEWSRMRDAKAMESTSQLFGQLFASAARVTRDRWTDGMLRTEALVDFVSTECFGLSMRIEICRSDATTLAQYGNGRVLFNAQALGDGWFDAPIEKRLNLIIHEIAHQYGWHTDATYHDALCRVGAKLAVMSPEKLREVGGE